MRPQDRAASAVVRSCHAGLDTAAFLETLVRQLPRVVPFEAGLVAVTDPTTMLYTHSALLEDSHTRFHPAFLANEYLEDDVMKYVDLARGPRRIEWLSRATHGHPTTSPRYRNLFSAIGIGDELRIAFVAGGSCWGVGCMARETGSQAFTEDDSRAIGRLAPHIAEALRTSLLREAAYRPQSDHEAPGVVVLAGDLSVLSATPAAERWLEELSSEQELRQKSLPATVLNVVNLLRAIEASDDRRQPRLRVRSRAGRWAVAYASYLSSHAEDGSIAVVIERAQRPDLAPLLLQAYGLTRKESEVAELVLRGRSTKEISNALFISDNTVQDHMKAIFAKVGVNSRRALVIRILSDRDPEFAASLI